MSNTKHTVTRYTLAELEALTGIDCSSDDTNCWAYLIDGTVDRPDAMALVIAYEGMADMAHRFPLAMHALVHQDGRTAVFMCRKASAHQA